jgi:hypothetical protein
LPDPAVELRALAERDSIDPVFEVRRKLIHLNATMGQDWA